MESNQSQNYFRKEEKQEEKDFPFTIPIIRRNKAPKSAVTLLQKELGSKKIPYILCKDYPSPYIPQSATKVVFLVAPFSTPRMDNTLKERVKELQETVDVILVPVQYENNGEMTQLIFSPEDLQTNRFLSGNPWVIHLYCDPASDERPIAYFDEGKLKKYTKKLANMKFH